MAIIDAATLYGASRWFRSVHSDPKWEYAAQYRAAEDRLLFIELLHDVLMYDVILLDRSSMEAFVSDELDDICHAINTGLERPLITFCQIAPTFVRKSVADAICRVLVATSPDEDAIEKLLTIRVPWYYSDRSHYDRAHFERAANDWRLDQRLVPLAIFIYRGACYSGYSRRYSQMENRPSAYLASPGRLQALAPIFDQNVMSLLKYPKEAYRDLVEQLDLPANGYDFSHLPFPEVTKLAELAYNALPHEALATVSRARQTREGIEIRDEWAARIWHSSKSCAVGIGHSNVIKDSTINGDVFQTILLASATN